jgi:methanogenic corrinoid protein MtbC1
MKEVIKAKKKGSLQEKVKIMIRGSPVDDGVRNYTGNDAYRLDEMVAVSLAK